jgi:hypothetical protein
MVNVDTTTIDKIIAQISAGKANTTVLKDFVVDLLVGENPEKFTEINFDKGIEWPAHEFELSNLTECNYMETQKLGAYEVNFYSLQFDAQCTLNGWQGANLVAKYVVNFSTVCTITMVGNHIVFKTVVADKTILTVTKNLLENEG